MSKKTLKLYPRPAIRIFETFQEVDRLLHDAEHAQSGWELAQRIGHTEPAAELKSKCDHLIAKAQQIDPGHKAPAWAEHKKWLTR